MCIKCLRVCLLRLRHHSPRLIRAPSAVTYRVHRLQSYVARGIRTIVQGGNEVEGIVRNPMSDGGGIVAFRCVKCSEEFQLRVLRYTCWIA